MTELPSALTSLLYDQANLEAMCRERPLDWSEYHHMNHFHGNSSVLKRYAGLPEDRPLPFSIEHAIPYDLSDAYDYDVKSGLATFLAVHEQSAQVYREAGLEASIPIGFTYLYALELYRETHKEPPSEDRKGTLVFPDKSTLLMDTDFDRKAFAEHLSNLPTEYQPVVVCIYWKDYVRGTHTPFEEAGLPIVSAGHMMDDDFQLRLHDLCVRFKYSCANDLAGSFTLSVISGCRFFFLNSGAVTQFKNGKKTTYEADPTLKGEIKQQCIAASPFPPVSSQAQKELALKNAGAQHQKGKSDLRTIYEEAEERTKKQASVDTFSFISNTETSILFSFLPTGIDSDGWIRNQSSFNLVSPGKTQKLMMIIEFPGWTGINEQIVTFSVDGDEHCALSISPGVWKFLLPLKISKGGNARIEIYCREHFRISGENQTRHRSLRIHSWKWVKGHHISISPEPMKKRIS